MIQDKSFPKSKPGMSLTNRSYSQKETWNLHTNHSEKPEKEYESIGEESSIQSIQPTNLKRDKSAECFSQFRRISSVSRDEMNQLELDLKNLRKDYLAMLEGKMKIEKEVLTYKAKIKFLEEKIALDSDKIDSLENLVKKTEILEKKYADLSEKLKDSNRELKFVNEGYENFKAESSQVKQVLEERINRLNREIVCMKQDLLYKDEYIEKLQLEYDKLQKICKSEYENKAVKTLSSIILSKDKAGESAIRLKTLEKDLEGMKVECQGLRDKNKELNDFINFLSGIQKDSSVKKTEEFEACSSLNLSKSSSESCQKITADGNKDQIIFVLKQKIETLKLKLDLTKDSKCFLSFLQCQASVIEDYLNEDDEVSQINSSLFSI